MLRSIDPNHDVVPSIQSWRQQISEKDLHFNSTVIMLRNQHYPPGGLNSTDTEKSAIGQGQMTKAVQTWFPTPNKTNSAANFSAWCHATQLYQADLYVSEIQFYRRGSGLPNRQLGSLYWQLNDIWQTPSWASVEYDGRWKVVHYAVKHSYEPVIIAPHFNRTSGNLSVWVTSDLWGPATGTAHLSWYDWTGKTSNLAPATIEFEVGTINSTQIFQTTVGDLPEIDLNNLVLKLEIEADGRKPNSEITTTFRHDNWFHPGPLSKASLVDPGLRLQYSSTTKNFTVTATTGVAAFVWLDYPAGPVLNFDSNAFWLAPNESREIGYTVKSDPTGGRWVHDVTVQSLWNSTLAD
jgi:beta-mannosidase